MSSNLRDATRRIFFVEQNLNIDKFLRGFNKISTKMKLSKFTKNEKGQILKGIDKNKTLNKFSCKIKSE